MELRNSLHKKILLSNLGFTIITLSIIFLSLQFWNRQEKLNEIGHNIKNINKSIVQLNRYEKDFYTQEIINPDFYATGTSVYLQKHEQAIDEIKINLNNIIALDYLRSLQGSDQQAELRLLHLNNYLNEYQNHFKQLTKLLIVRGFKDYGIEGRMRSAIHLFENPSYGVPQEKVLTLRRHEKDFIIRKDPRYAGMLEKKVGKIVADLETNRQLNHQQREQSIVLMNNYLSDFKRLQEIESEIGINQPVGLQTETAKSLMALNKEVETFIREVNQNIEHNEASQKLIYMSTVLLLLLASVILSFKMANYFTRPIQQVNRAMEKFAESAFELKLPKVKYKNKDELMILHENFNRMANEIQDKISRIKSDNDKLRTSNSQLESFSHVVSHDLKSPLRSINSFVGLLKRKVNGRQDEEEQQYMQYIQENTVKMANLINDLLSYSKVDAQGLSVQKVVFDDFMDDIHNVLKFHIAESKATINTFNQPILFQCDPIKMKRVFQNLISNAIKYVADDVRPEIKISCQSSKAYWQFSIEDNGLGIASHLQDQLFEPFTQLHDTTKYEGTGLGLSICQKIIESHGGQIWVSSEEGKGSTFSFTIAKNLNLVPNHSHTKEVATNNTIATT